MVTIATMVTGTNIGTAGLYSAVLFVILQEKGLVVNVSPCMTIKKRIADKYVVYGFPVTLIAIGCLRPVTALCPDCQVIKSASTQFPKHWLLRFLVKVTRHKDSSMGRMIPYLANGSKKRSGYLETIVPRSACTVILTGSMHHEDVQRVSAA